MGGRKGSDIGPISPHTRPLKGLEQIFSKRAFKHRPCSQGVVMLAPFKNTFIKERAVSLVFVHLLLTEINSSATSFVTREAVSQDILGSQGWVEKDGPQRAFLSSILM